MKPMRWIPMLLLLAGCGETTHTISQAGKAFSPNEINVAVGETITLLNDDTRTHNIRVNDPVFKFDSGAQEPGESVELSFPQRGRYYVVCGIHPTMKLTVDVRSD